MFKVLLHVNLHSVMRISAYESENVTDRNVANRWIWKVVIMGRKYTVAQRRLYLNMTDAIGADWIKVFEGDTEFYSAAYWDLFTNVWRQESPVRKTDALRFMTGIKSAHTAGKYIDFALKNGVLEESENPKDARSKLIRLSTEMRDRLDGFFDSAVDQVQRMGATLPKQK